MREIIVQIIMAFLGSLGFGIIFRMKLDRLFWGAFGGMLTWIVYLLAGNIANDIFTDFLLSAIFATIYAEVLARVKKAPATIFVLPAVVPLIPGSYLYYSVNYLMHSELDFFQESGIMTIKMALAIAVGMFIVGVLWNLVEQILYLVKR